MSIAAHKASGSISFFKLLYPLFVLLEVLSTFEHHVDPTRKLLIREYLDQGRRADLLKLARGLNSGSPQDDLIQEAIRKEAFTPFFRELYSDCMLLANQFYLNYYRGCHIFLRNVLEDLWRHLYYKDHKEEFMTIDAKVSERSMEITPQFFRGYLQRTSYLQIFDSVDYSFQSGSTGATIYAKNEDLYRRASSYVHATKETRMTKHSTNAEMKFDPQKAGDVESAVTELVHIAVAFLIAAHFDQFMRVSEYEKSIVLGAFDTGERQRFRRLFNI